MNTIHRSTVWEDSGFAWMARVKGNDAALVTQGDLSSIAYSVYDLDAPSEDPETGTLTIALVVFDTLQTDARWTKDATGYNFRWDVSPTLLATGGHRYRFEVKFTPTTGDPFHLVGIITASQLSRS